VSPRLRVWLYCPLRSGARDELYLEIEYGTASNIQPLAVERVRVGEVLVIDVAREVSAALFVHVL